MRQISSFTKVNTATNIATEEYTAGWVEYGVKVLAHTKYPVSEIIILAHNTRKCIPPEG